MNHILQIVTDRVLGAPEHMGFLDCIFGERKQEALSGAPVVLFGAGSLGQELGHALIHHGISPVCYCDTNPKKAGEVLRGIPIIGWDDYVKYHKNSLTILSAKNHATAISQLLIDNQFPEENLFCCKSDLKTNLVYLAANTITQDGVAGLKRLNTPTPIIDTLKRDEVPIQKAYDLLADQKSKDLLVSKLSLFGSTADNLSLFWDFISSYSEPFRSSGFNSHAAPSEDFYYFHNDVFSLEEDEVYVDVGAFDGDTIRAFIQACENRPVNYKKILAFEPDPLCFLELLRNTNRYERVVCHQLGLWSESKDLAFRSSGQSIHNQAATISPTGDIQIRAVSLDDFLRGESVTFIKMDPGANVIPPAIRGASRTIADCQPKLAIGAYHTIESIYEIPLLIHSICPQYRLYLRHNTYHLCDTVLYAVV